MSTNSDSGTAVKRPGLGLFVIAVACVLLPVSLAGPSVALPEIGEYLHADLTSVQWVINGYDLTFAAFMLASGSLGDLVGRRRVFRIGMAVFAGALLISAVAPNMLILDLARSVAGIGAAGVLTCGVASLAAMFEDPAARAKAFGVFGTSVGAGLAFGPFVCGTLNTQFGWRAVFYVPALIGILLLLASSTIGESRNPRAGKIDWAGTTTFTLALFALILGLLEGPQLGWGSGLVLGCLIAAVVLLGLFGVVERRVADPMFDLSLLLQRRYAALCLAVLALVFGFTPLLVYLPAYYSAVDGLSAAQAGLVLMMLTVPTLVLPLVTGYLAKWVSVRVLVLTTVVLTGAGVAWLTVIHPGAGALAVLGPYLVVGIGIGISFGVMDGAAVSAVDPARVGMAAGMFNTVRLGGEATGIAVVGAMLAGVTGAKIAGRTGGFDTRYRAQELANMVNQGDMATATSSVSPSARPAFQELLSGAYTNALHIVLWSLAGLCALAALILLVLDRPDKAASTAGEGVPAGDPAEAPA
ncbi:MFS transporter [Amycolatopsis dendrobii]|uniref:MFS transporter n=1 Tax=Amycolatopsis dendrobii TaxID=2760662 RepID=A0A7W3VWP6_9PSEU|nr:MFS transporter [Amycolatopsis dendrobii]MBB1154456.1 MFS transporter [Amycolatopsis dendrobii]